MKNIYKLTLVVFLLLFAVTVKSQQNSTNLTVQLSAVVLNSPPQIILNWVNDGTATGGQAYRIYRRIVGSGNSWGSSVAGLSASSSQYIDNNVVTGSNYEYYVRKSSGGSYGYGYINSSIELPVVENRGKLILVVEDTYIGNNDFDLSVDQTIKDIEADGWIVKRINVNRNDAVTSVKQLIVTTYNLDNINTKALYLLGHVPVPYSGMTGPDYHANHLGAWPADVYYADMDGGWLWTDNSVNYSGATRSQNHNIPGDGKFDQSTLPSNVELQMGRVDLSNLISFSNTEEELLIQYMNKAHDYKIKGVIANERSLIDNNFTSNSEGFASSGYRNFSVMFSPQNINDSIDYFTGTSANSGGSYMWSYGCGGGSYSSCGGIGTTAGLNNDSLQSIFTMLFGSYFGDWDSEDNFLRASIAQGQTLTAVWAGRPHWQFHHMALGSNIGVSTKLTQNNNGEYFSSNGNYNFQKEITIALMGDPTLRMHYISPPNNLTAINVNNQIDLNWSPSQDVVLGYNIYRILQGDNIYTKINNTLITSTNFTDQTVSCGVNATYIIKAVDLKTTASGSYFNQSIGLSTTISVGGYTTGVDIRTECISFGNSFVWIDGNNYTSNNNTATFNIIGGAFNGCDSLILLDLTINTINTSTITSGYTITANQNGATYQWLDCNNGNTFISGETNNNYTATSNGAYAVIISLNGCMDTSACVSILTTEVGRNSIEPNIEVYPNPTKGELTIKLGNEKGIQVSIIDITGKEVYFLEDINEEKIKVSLNGFGNGVYFVKLKSNRYQKNIKLIKQ